MSVTVTPGSFSHPDNMNRREPSVSVQFTVQPSAEETVKVSSSASLSAVSENSGRLSDRNAPPVFASFTASSSSPPSSLSTTERSPAPRV